MSTLIDQVDAVHRAVTTHEVDGEAARSVVLTRTYPYDVAEVWDALTTPERASRWIGGAVTGEARLGGRYAIEGNAEGTVLECEEPRHLRVTWEFGGGTSWVDADLTEADDGTTLRIEHAAVVSPHWETYGPGAVGVGWDLMVLGLSLHLAGESFTPEEAHAFATSPEAVEIMTRSGDDWGTADEASGTPAGDARRRAASTLAFYTGQPAPDDA